MTNSFKKLIYCVTFVLAMPIAQNALSETKITPSHVFQVVDNVANELILMHQADESEASYNKIKMTERRPRHVLQKAREVYQKVQILRYINDLPKNSVPDFPITEVTPENVKDLVDLILRDIKSLREIFGVYALADQAPLPSNTTPNDVYLNLVRVGGMIDGLDIPVTVPNDVFQIAETIIGDLQLILKKRNISTKIVTTTGSTNKGPRDAYDQSRELLSSIKQLCNKNKIYCLPGGVNIPPYHEDTIKPSHVIDTLNNALAELGSIKAKLGIIKKTVLTKPASGKAPNNVFDVVKTARNAINNMH